MKRIVFLLLLTSTLACAPAFAGGLNLASGTCWSAGGTGDATFACNTNTGSAMTLFASVIMPVAYPGLIQADMLFTIHLDGPGIPDWWKLQTGQCRKNEIQVVTNHSDLDVGCPGIYGGVDPLPTFFVDPAPPEIRLHTGAALTSDVAPSIGDPGVTEYNLQRINISAAKSTGAGSCAGCSLGACIVFDELKLSQVGTTAVTIITTAANRNFVRYNGGLATGPCPGAVTPALNRTWGAIKSLYR